MMNGCHPSTDIENEVLQDQETTIKVLYSDENAFKMLYGNLFSMKYPNIKIEVINTLPYLYQGNEIEPFIQFVISSNKSNRMF